jgi:hypothetical protein
MNLAPEIHIDWKIYLKILPSVDLFFPSGFFIGMFTPLHFAHFVGVIPGDFFLRYSGFSPCILGVQDLHQLLTLSEAYALPELANTSLVTKHEKHHACLIIMAVALADMLLHLFTLES